MPDTDPLKKSSSGWLQPAPLARFATTISSLTRRLAGSGGRSAPLTTAHDTPPAWRALLDALPDAVIALDSAGVIVHHNAPAGEFFPKIKVGQPISHVWRTPEFMAAVDQISLTPEPIFVEMVERVPVERRFRATLTRVAGVQSDRDPYTRPPQTLISFRDYSEQDKLAQMRADFIANASHELRTPLASLRGFVETLQGPARDDPKARERFLGLMALQATRMTRLIDDLLSLSRAEMRVHLPPRGIVDLNETCGFVVQTLEPVAQAARCTVTLERLPSSALIQGERDEIVQVLQNLLHNAIKYGTEDGKVDIAILRVAEAGTPRARLSIAITDNGPGIAPEHLPRLTERFYRASAATSRDKGGTGLGLAIVKHIVNRHRGDLKIQSVLGVGSTFQVTFDALMTGLVPPPQEAKGSISSITKIVTK
jgi:two-component system, OmpR family, phosphate regulon sensor histidine kinase PhoR